MRRMLNKHFEHWLLISIVIGQHVSIWWKKNRRIIPRKLSKLHIHQQIIPQLRIHVVEVLHNFSIFVFFSLLFNVQCVCVCMFLITYFILFINWESRKNEKCARFNDKMICSSEYSYSFECLWTKKDSHWWWIILPLGLFIVCLFYIFSRPNYVRLTTRTYQTLNASKNAIRCSSSKQYRNDLTPTSSLKCLFEQQQQRSKANKRFFHSEQTKYKTSTWAIRNDQVVEFVFVFSSNGFSSIDEQFIEK